MSVFFAILPFVISCFFCILTMGSVVLQCVGLYSMMKNRGMARPWLGAIPIVNLYALGVLGDNIQYYRGRRTTYRYWMLAYLIAYPMIMFAGAFVTVLGITSPGRGIYATMQVLPILVVLCGLVVSYIGIVMTYVCYYRIFQEFIPRDATFFTCMTIFFSMGGSFVFAIRNWPPVTGGAPFLAPARPPVSPMPR